jgi:hypothetical protein
VVETCVDCWAAELMFRGTPGPEEVVEYIDIRLLPAMARVVRSSFLRAALKPFVDFRLHQPQSIPFQLFVANKGT